MASSANVPPPIKDDYLAKLPKRKKLKQKNIKYWEDDAVREWISRSLKAVFSISDLILVQSGPKPPLDSSLKKHTTLLNRLKSALLTTSSETFLKELDGLTLTKYAEEITAAVLEGVSGTAAKGKADVEGAVEVRPLLRCRPDQNVSLCFQSHRCQVITHLHARLTPDFYPTFLPDLLAITTDAQNKAPITSGSGNDKDREKDEKDRISRMRPVLRLIAELGLVGAWEGYEGGKAMKGIKPEDIGPTLVFERLNGLVSESYTAESVTAH